MRFLNKAIIVLALLLPSLGFAQHASNSGVSGKNISSRGASVSGKPTAGGGGGGGAFAVGVTALPTSFADSSAPLDTGGTSLGNIAKLVEAWGGAVWRSRTGALALWGGGHTDYAGNQVYQYTITDATTQAVSRNNPTIPSALKCTNYATQSYQALPPVGSPTCTANGTLGPNATHTYNLLGYIAGTSSANDAMFSMFLPFPASGTPVPGSNVWKFTFSTAAWLNLGTPAYAGSMSTFLDSGMALVKKDDTHFYYWARNSFAMDLGEYNPTTNTVTKVAQDNSSNSIVQSAGAYDPVHNWLIHAMYWGSFVFVKTDLAGSPPYTVTDTPIPGSCPANTPYHGFSYDPASQKILIFPSSSVNVPTGNTFYLLDQTTMTCASWTAPGSAIATANHTGSGDTNGTYGRLQCGVTINGQTNLCVLLNDYNQPVYVIRTQ